MVDGAKGTNGGVGDDGRGNHERWEHGPGRGPSEEAAPSTSASERLFALLPFLMTMIADRGEKRTMRAALRLQMLFWVLSLVIDQLEATRGVMERARDRLRDMTPTPNQGNDSGDGGAW
ncbi:hypothetical protein [Roseospira visakhapatnamensis]|uniref:Uncharacterized protein n=1 Tax=Roseospira visakhapatnamensis TaxID=390880 RepID=A0A7W6RE30_9PROT|nr:hypothetical protein [Roseospira visakhapatnamensis]MBB4266768.1 hypothetical protein [Roseospira visakhapatnamensis]